jgi:hypothetical protein
MTQVMPAKALKPSTLDRPRQGPVGSLMRERSPIGTGRLGKEVGAKREEADSLSRAVLAIDEHAREIVRVNADELVSEAIASHDAARQRITELVADLDSQQSALRHAYVQVQSIMAIAGRNAETSPMRVPSALETLVREGGAPALLHPDDRVLAA